MDKTSILYVCLGIFGAITLPIGLIYIFSLIAPNYIVKAWVDRFFNIITFVPESLKRGPDYVLRKIMYYIKWTNKSFGIHDEEGGQRVTGTIIYAFTCLLSIFVSFLVLIVTLDAIYGDGKTEFLEYLPEYLNIEVVMAAELILASILFGLIIFDILGVTDLNMYFSPKRLSIYVRWAIGFVSGVCLVICIWLFGLTGNIRYFGANLENTQQAVAQEVQISSSKETVSSEQLENEVPPSYARSVKAITTVIPMIGVVAICFGFMGLLPLLNIFKIGIIFFIAMALFGPVWVFGYLTEGITIRLSEIIKGILYMIIDYVDSKKDRKVEVEYKSRVPAIPVNGDGKVRKEQEIQTII